MGCAREGAWLVKSTQGVGEERPSTRGNGMTSASAILFFMLHTYVCLYITLHCTVYDWFVLLYIHSYNKNELVSTKHTSLGTLSSTCLAMPSTYLRIMASANYDLFVHLSMTASPKRVHARRKSWIVSIKYLSACQLLARPYSLDDGNSFLWDPDVILHVNIDLKNRIQ